LSIAQAAVSLSPPAGSNPSMVLSPTMVGALLSSVSSSEKAEAAVEAADAHLGPVGRRDARAALAAAVASRLRKALDGAPYAAEAFGGRASSRTIRSHSGGAEAAEGAAEVLEEEAEAEEEEAAEAAAAEEEVECMPPAATGGLAHFGSSTYRATSEVGQVRASV
jgi:hypothetical protein